MSEEVTLSDLTQLRTMLINERQELENTSQTSDESRRPIALDQQRLGRLSRMDAIQQQEMTRAGRSTLELKRRQVEASLDGHTKGVYGQCRSCEEPIGYPRLRARPEAPFCLSCQDRRER